MDIKKYLILVKHQDKTKQIERCHSNGKQWNITYYNNQKVYTYSDQNVQYLTNPKVIDPTYKIVYVKDLPLSGVKQILDFGTQIKLVFNNGYVKHFSSDTLTIEKTSTYNKESSHIFEYFQTLAHLVSDKLDGEESFLSKQYKKLQHISPRSALATYIGNYSLNDQTKQMDQIVFPFGFNESQKLATVRAMSNKISIIEGPPGTGKTQTILNIIANALIQNKTVAVVSNNNAATSNVLEKLEKYDLGFIAAFLGNNKNKDRFFDQQNGFYPNMADWDVDDESVRAIKNDLKEQQKLLNKMLELQNKKAKLKQEHSQLRTEIEYFEDYYETSNHQPLEVKALYRLNADQVLKLLIEYQKQIKHGKLKLFYKLYNFFIYGFYHFSFYKEASEVVVSFLQKLYYQQKLSELEQLINKVDKEIDPFNFKKAMTQFSEDSMRLLKAHLMKKYGKGGRRDPFHSNVLWKNFGEFIKEYPVIMSTTHSLQNSAAKNYLFDYVLIDEASQVDIITGSLALSSAKQAVIVGDTKQLPNVVPKEVKEKTDRVFATYHLHSAYRYADNSLLTSMIHLFEQAPTTLLKEHYRCHPQIINFCNQKFYNNELVILSEEHDQEPSLILYKTAKGNHARGTVNQRQIDVITKEIIPNQIKAGQKSIGIVAPFRLQANELHKVKAGETIEADTVHKYQGREKDIIILSTVSNHMSADDFADNANLINVAVSRAVKKLIVVVAEGGEEWNGTNIGDLIKYMKYHNFEIKESEIYSVFDLLYRNYAKKLEDLNSKLKNVSAYKSENLINAVIESVLQEDAFQSIDFVMHQPLRMLIKSSKKLSADEYKYAMNILTHTDFLLFNKMDKRPVLVVEVDGHAFHANNEKQCKRDKMKDAILDKYHIPIIRLKTTGSEEERVIREKLEQVLEIGSVLK